MEIVNWYVKYLIELVVKYILDLCWDAIYMGLDYMLKVKISIRSSILRRVGIWVCTPP